MFDITSEDGRKIIVENLCTDLNNASVCDLTEDDFRTHLGMSEIGNECSAKIWLTFRWVKKSTFDGRQLRLFERGKLEESRFVKQLVSMGFDVKEFDEEGNQFKISGCDGHFGGSLDAMVKLPTKYGYSNPLIAEFKTHGEKSFKELKDKGLKVSKPQHYVQMCCYGVAYGFVYGLYVAVNKNTDEIHYELIEIDATVADNAFRKADTLIHSQEMPQRLSKTATFYNCKGCQFTGICHHEELPEKNCRSCKHCCASYDAVWICKINLDDEFVLSLDRLKVGCTYWEPIVNG